MKMRRAVLAAAMLGMGCVPSVAPENGPSFLYVQSGQGLKWFSVDVLTGDVSLKGSLATPKLTPSYLRPSPDRRFLYAAASDRLLVFSIGTDGSLTRAADLPSPGGPCYVDVHPSGRWVATANYGAGATRIFPVGPDGTVREALSHPSGSQSHSTRFHPGGKSLYTLSVGGQKITRFSVDGEGSPSTLAMPELGPRHIAFSPGGKFAYVVHERPIRVSSLRVGAEAGALEVVGTWTVLDPDAPEKKELAAAEIAVTPSGRIVYASVRDFSKDGDKGLNGLGVFAADAETGALRWVEFVPSGGVSPRGFVIDPSGTLLFVLNEIPGTLKTFRIDPDTGRLRAIGEAVAVGSPAIGVAWVTLPR